MSETFINIMEFIVNFIEGAFVEASILLILLGVVFLLLGLVILVVSLIERVVFIIPSYNFD